MCLYTKKQIIFSMCFKTLILNQVCTNTFFFKQNVYGFTKSVK